MTPRLWLLLLWLISYMTSVLIILLFLAVGESERGNTFSYLSDVTGLYVPYLSPIVAFWFSEDVIGAKPAQEKASFFAALVISAFFNLVMIGLLLSVFVAGGDNVIEETIKLMTSTGTLFAFLVGPAIGFFFSRTSKSGERADRRSGRGQAS